ncbi:hypothetical protein BSKO_11400 [Bryopsis sp. KO-2023]|nr:hypothetical protein BSKO_11400 [Bryopsis sp. KO-2023]
MALYFTKELSTRPGVLSAWSKASTSRALLALSLPSNAVGIYKEDGTPLVPGTEALIKNIRGSEAAQLSWHPDLMLLTIGWKDGAISFWNAEERRLNEDSKTHRCALTFLSWSFDGEHLATVDENGKVAMWCTDVEMHPLPLAEFEEDQGWTVSCLTWGDPVSSSLEEDQTNRKLYYATSKGDNSVVVSVNSAGKRTELFELEDSMHTLINYPEKEQLVCISNGCVLTAHGMVEEEGEYRRMMKMKFASGSNSAAKKLQVTWSCPHTLASAGESDSVIRLYSFDTEDNYVLRLDNIDASEEDTVSCLEFDQKFGILAVGTTSGKICLFRYVGKPTSNSTEGEIEPQDLSLLWEPLGMCSVNGTPTKIEFGPMSRLFQVRCGDKVTLCGQTFLQSRMKSNLAAVQTGADKVVVEHMNENSIKEISSNLQIVGLDITDSHLLLWSGNQVEIYNVNVNGTHLSSQFPSKSSSMAIHNDSIYRTGPHRLEVCSLTGTVKQTLYFDSDDGCPTHLDVSNDFLGVLTDKMSVRVYKIGGREARPFCTPQQIQFDNEQGPFEGVVSVRLNSNGTKISILGSMADIHTRDTRIIVHDIEAGATISHDFASDMRIPESHCWDSVEPRLLAVQTSLSGGTLTTTSPIDDSGNVRTETATLFASEEHGMLVQDFEGMEHTHALIGLDSPDLIFFRKNLASVRSAESTKSKASLQKKTMRCFQGISGIDGKTKSALLDFSFYLAIGALEDAVKSIKMIHNPQLWENMAQMCIKNRRMDVAELCMKNMEHYRGARALRESQNLDSEIRVANAAVHMDMIDDAKKMLQRGKHYDRLNKLYQACGQWGKALDVSEKHDRIHLKATHFQRGRDFEKTGDFRAAVQEFEKSGCHRIEVPRMLHEAGKTEGLERYIKQSGDRELMQWWGRYCESQGDLAAAIAVYKTSDNTLALVRALCFEGKYREAEQAIKETKDPAAAFHLGRQYEAQEKIRDAIRLFSMAGRPNHGVRLARLYELDAELLSMALLSSKAVMLESAEYFNEKEMWDKAVMLYHKGGKPRKALELCLAGELFNSLDQILNEVDCDGDPALISSVAATLLQHGEFEKATKLLLKLGQEGKALELCLQHDVAINEAMAEALTPEENSMGAAQRNAVICKIAKACKQQGSFHLAAKKYAQAGERIKAMKALVKSGDKDRVIMFATRSRQREVYMMAANYLQMMDWHNQPDIMKSIISFYTKAKAHDSLVAFFEACGQIEIDEYRDYDKALQAMNQALKHAEKSQSTNRELRLASIGQRLELMEKFITARQIIPENPQLAIEMCIQLLEDILEHQDAGDTAVRMGDVYALMIEFWFGKEDMENAFKLIEEMKSRNIILTPYLDRGMLEAIHKAVGVEGNFRHTTEEEIIEEQLTGSDDDYNHDLMH